jgi:hypothetical protein
MQKQGTLVEFKDRKAYAEFLQWDDKLNRDLSAALGYKRK